VPDILQVRTSPLAGVHALSLPGKQRDVDWPHFWAVSSIAERVQRRAHDRKLNPRSLA